jgi:hypothetical protein
MGILDIQRLQIVPTFVQLVKSSDLFLSGINLLLKDRLSILKVSLLVDNSI